MTERDDHAETGGAPVPPAPSVPPVPHVPAGSPLADAAAALGFDDRAAPSPEPPPTPAPASQPPYAQDPATAPFERPPLDRPAAAPPPPSYAGGVPPRPNPLPPPRPARPAATTVTPPRPDPRTRPVPPGRPAGRSRKARLVLKRVDPWSVFLYSVVASIFIGIALVVAIGVLYAVMSKLGVLTSLNELIGDVTSEPGTTSTPSDFFSVGKVMTVAGLIAAVDVVLITLLATLGAFLYNLCAALTGGIEVTLSDQS